MKNLLIASAIAATLLPLPGAYAAAASSSDLAEIRDQLQGLIQRVDKLEQENTSLKTENAALKSDQENLQAQGDYLKSETKGLRKDAAVASTAVNNLKGAEWASRFTLAADLRYRYEFISDEALSAAGIQTADRYRDRIRVRFNAVGRPTDSIQVGLGFATTEGGDPRSGNQTLTGSFSRKSLDLDLAYFDWTVASWAHLIGGKMRQPFIRAGQSLFWDGDVNPEGLAVTFTHGIWFGSAYNFWINEVSGAQNTRTADASMAGAQFGARLPVGSSTLILAAHYYYLSAAQGRSPFFGGSSNGNTTVNVGTPAVAVLLNDYEVIDVMAQFNAKLGELPLQLWANGVQNQEAANFDTAWAAGFLLGAAGNYHTWEFGVNYHSIEKDALFAQLVDSDFAGGTTDAKGWVIRGGYAPLKNWTLNATYFLNKRNVDVPAVLNQTETDYDRLQLDFNVKF